MLATLGETVFEASSELIRTFAGAQHETSARWQNHEVIGQKPVAEFIGPGLRKLSFTMRLDVGFGIDPLFEADALRVSCEAGEVLPLMIGGYARGDWKLLTVGETWRNVTPDGTIRTIDLSLSLEEYA